MEAATDKHVKRAASQLFVALKTILDEAVPVPDTESAYVTKANLAQGRAALNAAKPPTP